MFQLIIVTTVVIFVVLMNILLTAINVFFPMLQIDIFSIVMGVFLISIIPLEIIIFEVYLYFALVIRRNNVYIEDRISLPFYESIYIFLLAIGENIISTVYNNPTGGFLSFEIPKDTLLLYILILLYLISLNCYYKRKKLYYLLLMLPAIFESFFHLYYTVFIYIFSKNFHWVELLFFFPFLPLVMTLILLRLYIIRKNYNMTIVQGSSNFKMTNL